MEKCTRCVVVYRNEISVGYVVKLIVKWLSHGGECGCWHRLDVERVEENNSARPLYYDED